MKPVIVSEEAISKAVTCSSEELAESIRVHLDAGDQSVIPLFLRSYLPEDRCTVGIASRSPFFFESMLREAQIDFMYDAVEAPPDTDQSYESTARSSLTASEVQELFDQFRRISSVAMYDFWFELEDEQLWFSEGSWLACRPEDEAVIDAAERFAEEH